MAHKYDKDEKQHQQPKMHYNWNKDQKAQILEVGFISPFGRVDLRNHIR